MLRPAVGGHHGKKKKAQKMKIAPELDVIPAKGKARDWGMFVQECGRPENNWNKLRREGEFLDRQSTDRKPVLEPLGRGDSQRKGDKTFKNPAMGSIVKRKLEENWDSD